MSGRRDWLFSKIVRERIVWSTRLREIKWTSSNKKRGRIVFISRLNMWFLIRSVCPSFRVSSERQSCSPHIPELHQASRMIQVCHASQFSSQHYSLDSQGWTCCSNAYYFMEYFSPRMTTVYPFALFVKPLTTIHVSKNYNFLPLFWEIH